ncbi:MAG TPA: amidohydrolase [Rhodanobacteraceae bacterium]|nr:amidohydrolase [Rhodanobacteraceae bacterium]
MPDEAGSRLAALKRDAIGEVEERRVLTQQIVDSLFSFSELGYQEFETQRYLTALLERNGFTVERGIAGMPSAWIARWGSGRPVIALGADVDGVPTTSQTPGVLARQELVPGAPGHGEGHNSGPALVLTAALAAKAIMERERLPGTLVVWPGIAEELLAGKAYFVRSGIFRDVDAVLYAHVNSGLGTEWGDSDTSSLVSVEYTFTGESSHAARAPWLGRSALDAVELMNVGWNYRREHLRLAQRSHYVISDGGDQPNVVPPLASVWYYFRENDYAHVQEIWEIGNQMAQGAALMTGTEFTSRVLGSAWPHHRNRPLAEAIQQNIELVGLPQWSEADQQFARAVQRSLGVPEIGLETRLYELDGVEEIPDEEKSGGASDDIGDVMWSAPTAFLAYPANVRGTTTHNWTAAIAMATPVAHKGTTQGAMVYAATIIDLVSRPDLVAAARDYFENVQGEYATYTPYIREGDEPVVTMNKDTMDRYRPELAKHYYDARRFKTYLEQLGVAYPPAMPPPAGSPASP